MFHCLKILFKQTEKLHNVSFSCLQVILFTFIMHILIKIINFYRVLYRINNIFFTISASGTYLYIEASSPSHMGDQAIIRSHVMPGNKSACFTFWYNMHGIDTGNLTVYIEVGYI